MIKQFPFLLSALFLCTAAHGAAYPVEDCLVGNGTPGPYQLSWQHILTQLVSVTVNNQAMVAGLDYTVDGGGGSVKFLQPVPANSAVVVDYECDPSMSMWAATGASIPLAFNYAANQQSSLFAQGALQSQGLTQLNVGMRTAETSKRSGFTGQILYSALANDDPDSDNRFAAILHGQTNPNKQTHITIDWTSAGAGFQSSPGTSAAAGDDHLQVVAKEDLSKQVTATITDTQDDKEGVSQSTNVVSVAAAPDPHLKIAANITDSSSSASGNSQTSAINAQDGVTKTLSLTASAVQTDQPTDKNLKQQIGINVTPNKTIQVAGTVTTVTDQSITSQVAAVSTTYQPVSQIKVDAGYEDRNSSPSDSNAQHFMDTTRVQVTVTPAKNLSVSGKYGQNIDDGSGNPQSIDQQGVAVQSKLGNLSLQSGYNWTQSTNSPQQTTELTLGVGANVGHTAISAKYDGSVAAAPAQPSQQTQTYTVSLNRSLSNRVLVSINGSMTQSSGPNTSQAAPNYTTSANIGFKF